MPYSSVETRSSVHCGCGRSTTCSVSPSHSVPGVSTRTNQPAEPVRAACARTPSPSKRRPNLASILLHGRRGLLTCSLKGSAALGFASVPRRRFAVAVTASTSPTHMLLAWAGPDTKMFSAKCPPPRCDGSGSLSGSFDALANNCPICESDSMSSARSRTAAGPSLPDRTLVTAQSIAPPTSKPVSEMAMGSCGGTGGLT